MRNKLERESEEVFIIGSVIGILAFDSENKVIEKELLPMNPEAIANALLRLERGEAIAEVKEVLGRLSRRGFKVFTFENKELAKTIENEMGFETRFEETTAAGDLLRAQIIEIALEMGGAKGREDFYVLMQQVATKIASERVAKESGKTESMIIQGTQILEELDKIINVLSTKAREWYGSHFPELSRLIDEHETYMNLIVKLGSRENFTAKNLEKMDIPSLLSKKTAEKSLRSIGGSLRAEDLETIRRVCQEVLSLYDLRNVVSNYVASLSKEIAPNTVELVGPQLTAKLIAKAGAIATLARMPSSKLQILGAEKAMFRSMKTGSKPPKHGLIFQHPLLHSAPMGERGKIARALAGKLIVAVRVDTYSERFIGDQLREDLEERIRKLITKKGKKKS